MLFGRDDRPEVRAGLEPRPDARLPGPVRQRADNLVELVAMDEQAAAGVAGLPGVEVDPLEGPRNRGLDVGIRKDDVRRLAAELEGDALQPRSSR